MPTKPTKQYKPLKRGEDPNKPTKRGRLTGETMHRVTGYGRCLTIPQWADLLGVCPSTLYSRRRLGYTDAEILSLERIYKHEDERVTPRPKPPKPKYFAHRGQNEYLAAMSAEDMGAAVGCSARNIQRSTRGEPRTLRSGWKISLDTSVRDGGDILHHGMGATSYYMWSRLIRRHTKMADPMFRLFAPRTASVCTDWLTFDGFDKWYRSERRKHDMPDDRVVFMHVNPTNRDMPYSPQSCRLVTIEEADEVVRGGRIILDGEVITTPILCRLTGCTPKQVSVFVSKWIKNNIDSYAIRALK